jgi:hypothetical protein
MTGTPSSRLPWLGTGIAVAVIVVAIALPAALSLDVHVDAFPPLHAVWAPRVGPGTLPAILLAGLASWRALQVAEQASWRRLLGWAFVAALAWLLALALVDGLDGIRQLLDEPYEYLRTARRYSDFGSLLPDWTRRIPYAAVPHNWSVHVAGHPPGATFFFWVLVQLDLGNGTAAGLVVTVIAATTPLAVMTVLRTLGAEVHARRAAPFLVFGPAAIWSAVSADAVFAAAAAWGMAALALAAVARGILRRVGWSLCSGLLLGATVMMSYGLPLMGILALVVLWLARGRGGSWWPLPIAAAGALGVVLGFAAYGFDYLEALPALHTRYFEAVGGRRQFWYWSWADLALLAISAGPLLGAGLAVLLGRARGWLRDAETRVAASLALAGAAMVTAADLSLMSKAEVERIWLPFVPWLLVSCALLPERWRRPGLIAQVVFALVVQHLFNTGW